LVEHVGAALLWANMNLLFWLSLVPFTIGWMGKNNFAPLPTAAYGVSLLMPALAWQVMQWAIIRGHGHKSIFAQAFGRDLKGKISLVLYTVGIALAFVDSWAAGTIYLLVALMWLIPDRPIERMVERA
jgi:uncharacterized membrane protein